MERSKSAPKLMAIEEAVGEEEEICSMPSFKKSQSHIPHSNVDLFTATNTIAVTTTTTTTAPSTFDRKYCKRNRSNRDLAISRRNVSFENSKSRSPELNSKKIVGKKLESQLSIAKDSSFDEDDDFNNLLMTNDYDIKSSLSGEILSYFDTKLNKSSSLSQSEIDSHPAGATGTGQMVIVKTNSESNSMTSICDFDSFNSTEDSFCSLGTDSTVFNQNDVLNSLVAHSKGIEDCSTQLNSVNLSNCIKMHETNNVFVNSNGNVIVPFVLDSDEGSITSGVSGCETSSIITTAHMDDLMKSEREIDAITLSLSRLPLKHTVSNLERVSESDNQNDDDNSNMRNNNNNNNEEDSEFSDESGFDENNSGKSNNFRTKADGESTTTTMLTTTMTTTTSAINCNADANNNIKQHTFNSNTIKSVGRLRINIPKNAKSIDI